MEGRRADEEKVIDLPSYADTVCPKGGELLPRWYGQRTTQPPASRQDKLAKLFPQIHLSVRVGRGGGWEGRGEWEGRGVGGGGEK